jgi:hypothetical protein
MKANLCMFFLVFIMTVLLLEIKLSQGIGLIPKRLIRSRSRRRTDNAMAKRNRTKRKAMINKNTAQNT